MNKPHPFAKAHRLVRSRARCQFLACAVAALTAVANVSWAAADKAPAPETVTLETKDAAVLNCTYYASPKAEEDGKTVVPVIILHGWGGQRSQFDALATYLQSLGHAVIVPDMRGHGSSTTIKRPGEESDLTLEMEDGQMNVKGKPIKASDVLNYMVMQDVEAVKSFLLDKNNAGELNIELLCVVGVDEGCLVAINWAEYDWHWTQLPNLKQGRDVKALVLVSPVQSFMGFTVTKALLQPIIRDKMNVMIVVGAQDSAAFREAGRLYTKFKAKRPPVPDDKALQAKKQDLFLVDPNTSLQGVKLLSQPSLEVDKKIAGFIQLRLINKADLLPWTER